jgi:hypothetical protein
MVYFPTGLIKSCIWHATSLFQTGHKGKCHDLNFKRWECLFRAWKNSYSEMLQAGCHHAKVLPLTYLLKEWELNDLFLDHLMTPFQLCRFYSVQCLVMNSEFEGTWTEGAVAYFNLLFQHIPGENEENHNNISVKIAGLRIENQTWDFQNAKQEC